MRITELFIVISFSLLSGCFNQNVNIQTTRIWENHYMTVESFREGTKDINLQKDETIWVLSNTTLKRVLKEVSREK